MSGIVFINYRRRDAEHVAGRLFDRLEQDFSQDRLFFDVDDIPPGEDFVAYLNSQVDACDVLLALVGPNWQSQLDAQDYGEGEQTKDFVRIEIEAALQKGKKVIPVLVSGAEMPREEDLPESLRPFSRRNAVRLTHERFRADAAGITGALKAALVEAEEARAAAEAEAERQRAEKERKAKSERDAKAQAKKDSARREAIAGLSPQQIAKAEELANWDFIKGRDEPQEFRDHLARFPDGVSARMAGERLEALLWRGLGAAPDEAALEVFLDEFPESVHASEARAHIERLQKAKSEERTAKEREAKERSAWNAVKDTTDADTLNAFLADFPRGAHAGEARRLKSALQGGLFTRRKVLLGGAAIGVAAALATGIVLVGLGRVPIYDPVRTFDAEAVVSVAFSPDGRTALSAEDANGSRLWDMTTGEELKHFDHEIVKAVAFSPDGRTAFSAGYAGLKLWDLASGEELPPFKGNESYADAIAVAPDGRTVLASNYVKTSGGKDIFKLVLWDVATGKQLRTFERPDGENPGYLITFSSDGSTIMSAGSDKIDQWDVETSALLRTIEIPGGYSQSIALAPDGRTVLSANSDNSLGLWDVATGKLLRTLEGHEDSVDAVAISPDGRLALSGAQDGAVKLWDLATGEEIGILEGHSFDVVSVTFAPDGRTALSGSLDGTMKLWDVTR